MSAITLQCLGGKAAPPGLAEDLRRILALPPVAAARLWSVLGPSLAEPLPEGLEQQLDAFCREHDLSRADLARPVKAARFLLREAAGMDLAREAVAADLLALCPDAPEIEGVLLAGYDSARAFLRQEMLQGTLADHGKLLVGVDWRRDAVEASSRGAKMRVPVAFVTLRYREGEETKRITLQVLPAMLEELKRTWNEIAPDATLPRSTP